MNVSLVLLFEHLIHIHETGAGGPSVPCCASPQPARNPQPVRNPQQQPARLNDDHQPPGLPMTSPSSSQAAMPRRCRPHQQGRRILCRQAPLRRWNLRR